MAKILGNFLLLLLLVLPSTLMLAGNGGSSFVRAEDAVEDAVEGEDDLDEGDATVETDEGGEGAVFAEEEATEDEDEESPLKPSPDADTHLLFTKPVNMEFAAGELVKILVGFTNNGEKDFVVESIDASFRYPQDFSFYIQNFTAVGYHRQVEGGRQATFEYPFQPSDSFSGRPFGLTINLNYRDSDGNMFQQAMFNETITLVEPDEGLDGETFFLYVFLAALVVLLLVGAQQLLASFGVSKKRMTKSKAAVEMGTQNNSDIDYDWIPKEALNGTSRSPGRSPKSKTSPRNRKAKRMTGDE